MQRSQTALKFLFFQSPSNGSIEAIEAIQKHPYLHNTFPIRNFYAKIHINDTSKVKATLTIYKRGTYSYVPSFGNLEATKSFTIVYARNASPKQKPHARSSIGKRQTGDKLIHFHSRNVTNSSRFPSSLFEYVGEDCCITYVGFSFNVSVENFNDATIRVLDFVKFDIFPVTHRNGFD